MAFTMVALAVPPRAAKFDAQAVERSVARVETSVGVGAGFVVGPGKIVTANHVVAATDSATVTIGQTSSDAIVIRRDPDLDIALLDVSPALGIALTFTEATPVVLDEVYAIG